MMLFPTRCLTSLVFLWSLTGPVAASQYGDFTYSATGGVITITGYTLTAVGRVDIPGYILGTIVAGIGEDAFSGCAGITEVYIPPTVTRIDDGAFAECSSLERADLPPSLVTLGSYAFYGCVALTEMEIPEGVTEISSELFGGCTSLRRVTIPSATEIIHPGAFVGCSSLAALSIPASVTEMNPAVFEGCVRMEAITVDAANPEFASRDGVLLDKAEGAILRCPGGFLGHLTIPESVETIWSEAFKDCVRLTGVTLPPSVTFIGRDAFSGCCRLEAAHLPAGVRTIYERTFEDCGLLKTVTFSPLVNRINERAFAGCAELTGIALPTGLTTLAPGLFAGCARLTSVALPPGLTSIAADAFKDCTGLTGMTIPASVTTMTAAYPGCRGLESVTFAEPASLGVLGTDTFKDCTSLANLVLPSSLTALSSPALRGCTGLTSIHLPAALTSLSGAAFDTCSSLTAIHADVANATFSTVNGALHNKDQTVLLRCPTGFRGHFSLLPSLTQISFRAFENCIGLTGVTFPEPSAIVMIGDSAFARCVSLERLDLPSSVLNVLPSAFSGCTALASVTLSPAMTRFRVHTFHGCVSLATIFIPAGFTQIGNGTFAGLRGLASIEVDASNATFSSVDGVLYDKNITTLLKCPSGFTGSLVIPSTVTSISGSAFSNCVGLTEVTLPPSVTTVGTGAFAGCSGLASVIIPPSVTALGSGAFAGCSGLTEVTIPAGVPAVGNVFFEGCLALRTVLLPASVTNISASAFDSCPALEAIVVDPANPAYSSVGGALLQNNPRVLVRCPAGLEGVYAVPPMVLEIGVGAFAGCEKLTEIMIPPSVEYGGYDGFRGTLSLETITVDPANSVYSSVDGVLFDEEQLILYWVPGRNRESYTIPATITTIQPRAFDDCAELRTIGVAPGGLSFSAFEGVLFDQGRRTLIRMPCGFGGSYTIPSTVTRVANSAFTNCIGLTRVVVPASVRDFLGRPFIGCESLTETFMLGHGPSVSDSSTEVYRRPDMVVFHFEEKSGFVSLANGLPSWFGFPAISMGKTSPFKEWQIAQSLGASEGSVADAEPLLLAYALNLDPHTDPSASLPVPVFDGTDLSLSYYAGNASLAYRVETSTGFGDWTTEGVTVSEADENGLRVATVNADGPERYLRLVVWE